MIITIFDVFQWIIYFASLYFVVFWMLVLLDFEGNGPRRRLKKNFPLVSVVIPAYNEEKAIAKTIKSALALDYPQDKMEIIVVNDGSTDRTDEIVRQYLKKHKSIKYINQKNSGKGAALNNSLKVAKGEFWVCLDADSEIEPDALKLMLPEFSQDDVGAVLALMKAKAPESRLQKFQFYEYVLNIFYKKLMGVIDCIHVAPGPFTIYKTRVLLKEGGFDEDNLTEDLELTVRLQKKGYKIVQNMHAVVYTITPYNLKAFLRQRKRWFKGGVLNALKYKDMLFNPKYGDFGIIQLPVLLLSGLISTMLVVTALHQFLKPYYNHFTNLLLVNFDFLTFLNDLRWTVNILDFSYANVVMLFIMLFITLTTLFLAHKYTREKPAKYGKVTFVLFLFFYFFLLGLSWLAVIKDFVFGVKQRW